MGRIHVVAIGVMVILAAVWLGADTLFLRDGRRVQGWVIGIRDGVIEFEEERGFQRRRIRVNRNDVRRIEFDELEAVEESNLDERDDDSARGDERPRGLREREVIVSADVAWNDAGVDVRAGRAVYFASTGRVSWGPGRRDDAGGERDSPRNPGRPIPNRPGAALIGRIDDSDPFFIGNDQGAIRMRASGRLYLGVNDDYLLDNSSNFRVTVYY